MLLQNIFKLFFISLILWNCKTTGKNFKTKDKRIAYIDLDYVFRNSSLKTLYEKARKKNLQKEFNKVKNLENNSVKNNKQINQISSYLGYKEFQKKYKSILSTNKKIYAQIDNLNTKRQDWNNEMKLILFDKLLLAISIITEDQELDFVLSKEDALIYSKPKFDISQDAVRVLRQIEDRNSLLTR